ncbi:MAG: TlpA disulfide reductase family protein [Chloroflexota bacterium]
MVKPPVLPRKDPPGVLILGMFIAGGFFLLGAALLPLMTKSNQAASERIQSIRLPSTANYPAPDLKLTDLAGEIRSLSDYSGVVVLVNNWATWCPPCQSEMPELQAYFQAHASQGFLLVAIESGDPASQVSAFVEEYGLTFPVWLDPHADALMAFNNWSLPSSYLIDRSGTIRYSWIGEVNRITLEEYVTPLLEE